MSVVNSATTVNGSSGTLTLQTNGVNAASVNSNQNISFVNTINTPNTFSFKNRIIDGGFIINQRSYVSGTALSAGTYAHDRWKAGASGCTYTFTQGALGVNTTITITAGSLIQVIEGCNLSEGGTYVLSWTGTAQGSLNGGSFGASGITITGWTPGTNLNVEFNTGTLGNVQLEVGSTATSFDYRPYPTELALCQRYYELSGASIYCPTASGFQTPTFVQVSSVWKVQKRTSPTVTIISVGTSSIINAPTVVAADIIGATYNATWDGSAANYIGFGLGSSGSAEL